MSVLSEMLGGGLSYLSGAAGESVTYFDLYNIPTETTAIVGNETLREIENDDDGVKEYRRRREFTFDTRVIANVQRLGKVRYSGEDWSIVEIASGGTPMCRAIGEREETHKRGRPGLHVK